MNLDFLRVGPDAMLFVDAIVVAAVVLALTRLRARLRLAALVAGAVALILVVIQASIVDAGDVARQLVAASFIVVPTAMVVGIAQVGVIARHAWWLALIGPVVFLAGYVGICEACAHLIGGP